MQVKINYKNTEDFLIISMLKELEAVTLTGFESLLTSLLNQTCNQSQVAGLWFPSWCTTKEWYVRVQKQMQHYNLFVSHKKSKSDYFVHIENMQTWLGKLESNIQEFEEELECLSRHLVKTRVSLLNTLNH